MKNQVVSIITPSFNRGNIIHETAHSIFTQTYDNWEWIIVDDGSTDSSWKVLEGFAAMDQRVKIFNRDRGPKGACTCRNIGVEKSTGNFLLFLDTDDLLAPFCLDQRIEAAISAPDADFIIFPMLLFKENPSDLGLLWNIDKNVDEIQRMLIGDAICQGTGTLWKRDAFINTGMWKEDLKLWQDVELHLRAFIKGIPYAKRMDLTPDVYLRISDVSLSRTGYNQLPKLQSRKNVYMQTVEMIEQQSKTIEYKSGLRHMGWDIIVSAIQSRHFSEADQLITFTKSKSIFSDDESIAFERYSSFVKYKLYKIPFIMNGLKKKVFDFKPHAVVSIGKESWQLQHANFI